jgi:glycosyltransferase involved in cell wall biosynthesis
VIQTDASGGRKTVTVLIAAYGTAPYIAETIESVLAQTFTDYEIIVINDGDPDTPAMEAALAPYRDRIVYLKKANGGVSSARNLGLPIATGSFIALLDSDDLWKPDFLEKMVGRLGNNPDFDVAFPDAVGFGVGPRAGHRYYDLFPRPTPGGVTLERLLRRDAYVFGSLLIRREVLDRAGPFDEQLRASEDYEMWLRLAKIGARFSFIDETLVLYRGREASLSADGTGMCRSLCLVYRKMLGYADLTAGERAAAQAGLDESEATLALVMGRRALAAGDTATAQQELVVAHRHFGGWKTGVLLTVLRFWPGSVSTASRWYMRWRG